MDLKSKNFLARNLIAFAQALRRAGAPVAPGATLDAIAAIEAVGLERREDFCAALRCVFVKGRDHALIFDQIFDFFWRRRDFTAQMIALLSPSAGAQSAPKPPPGAARVAAALSQNHSAPKIERRDGFDARFAASDIEILQTKDFAQMSAAEILAANEAIKRLSPAAPQQRSRSWRRAGRGAFDPRASFRASSRSDAINLFYRQSAQKPAPIVALCDVSGSMSDYTRVFLHFLHVLSQRRRNVRSFLFGTRLTNVTRALQEKDPDAALARCAKIVEDWEGGTRIGACLRDFNRNWLRRVMGQGAICLLFSDGLERERVDLLEREVAFLSRFSRRLIWLNPLLRYSAFAPKASGVRAILRHVDEFRPIHNLSSVEDLARALAREQNDCVKAFKPEFWLK